MPINEKRGPFTLKDVVSIRLKLLFFALLLFINSYSQVDGLIQATKSGTDSARAVASFKLAEEYRNTYPDSTKYYLENAILLTEKSNLPLIKADVQIKLAKYYLDRGDNQKASELYNEAESTYKINDHKIGLARYHLLIGNHFFSNGDTYAALENQRQALSYFTELDDTVGMSSAYNNMANAYARSGNYPNAVDLYLKTLSLAEKLGNLRMISTRLNNLASIHYFQGNLDTSIEYFKKSIAIRKQIGETAGYAGTLNNLAKVLIDKNEYDSSYKYASEALSIARELKAKRFISGILPTVARALSGLKKYSEAKDHFEEAVKLAEEQDRKFLMSEILMYQGIASYENKKIVEGIEYFQKAMALAEFSDGAEVMKECYQYLSKSKQQLGQFKEALEYQLAYETLKDSLSNKARSVEIAQLESNFELEKKEKENEMLKTENQLAQLELEANKNRSLSFRVIAIASVLIAVLVLIALRIIVSKNKLLKNQNGTIQEQNEELLSNQEEIQTQSEKLEKQNESLEKARKIVDSYNKELEKEVEKKTRELALNNEKLKSHFNQLEQFSFLTAHNLRGPIARLLGLMSLLEFKNNSPKDLAVITKKFHHSILELDKTVKDIGRIVEIQHESTEGYIKVNPDDVIKNVVADYSERFAEAGVSVDLDLNGSEILTRPESVMTCLKVIINNSLKFKTNTDAAFHISTSSQSGSYTLTVRDNGIGFDLEAVKNKLFEPFQQFHVHVKGRGLGLYVLKNQVTELGGNVEIQSTVEQGTEIKITIPTDPA